jgi:hypothetical protein
MELQASQRSMAAVNGVIEHLCARQEHQLPEDVASPVIVYAGKWGYCPAGPVDGHEWRATGGRTLATVREWLGRPPTVERDDEAKSLEGAVRR